MQVNTNHYDLTAKAKTIEALKKAKTVVAALKEGNESKMDVAAGK
jgi:hypothetical protein